jgi:hypothetical protein
MERSSATQSTPTIWPRSTTNRNAPGPGLTSSTRRRLRFYSRGLPVLLSVGAVMALGASPAGELLGVQSAEAARTAPSLTPDTCQIKGFAFVDENANGRFDSEENGLAGAVLTLRGRSNWFHAAADRVGRFSVAGLPAGQVVITIDSPRAAERFGPARRTVTVGTKCVSLDAIALVPEQTEFASFG